MNRHRARAADAAMTKLYATALGISIVGGFSAGVWAPAFWLGITPLIIKLLACVWAKQPRNT